MAAQHYCAKFSDVLALAIADTATVIQQTSQVFRNFREFPRNAGFLPSFIK